MAPAGIPYRHFFFFAFKVKRVMHVKPFFFAIKGHFQQRALKKKKKKKLLRTKPLFATLSRLISLLQ